MAHVRLYLVLGCLYSQDDPFIFLLHALMQQAHCCHRPFPHLLQTRLDHQNGVVKVMELARAESALVAGSATFVTMSIFQANHFVLNEKKDERIHI